MRSFERSGLVFDVEDGGRPDADAVVLLHGFPQDASAYAAVVPSLHERGLRTLVPTQRGYAASARPRRRRDYRIGELVGDVLALLDAAGRDRAHLVGHDWGGGVAWALAGWHPERVASLTVLSSPHPAALSRALLTSSQGVRLTYMAAWQLPWLPERLLSRTLHRTLVATGLPPEQADRYLSALAAPGALTGALNWYRGLPFAGRRTVPVIAVPTTYVWGRHDFALVRRSAETTARHVTGRYAFVELDAGHWLPETRPEEVAEAVLARVATAPPS